MTFLSSFFRRKRPSPSPRRLDESIYRALAEQASDVLVHFEPGGRVTYISPSVQRVLGYTPEQVIGTDMLWMVAEQDRSALAKAIADLGNARIAQLRHQSRLLRPDGTLIWVEGSSVITEDGTGSIILVLRDIAERKHREEELAALALEDALTGLANRRSFDQTLDLEWRRTVREMSELSLLLLDLDHFKQFNDEYGHQAGDDCLRSVAAAIKSSLFRPGDLACRYGGEEFAVILSRTNTDGAIEIAERIRHAVEDLQIPHSRNSAAPVVTTSIGIATALARAGGTMRMPEGLLQAADHALYRAKSEGRNRFSKSLLFAPTQET
jgi:diguanylate cyclase (GGDEF)-like protein/PAS domain S-box-containing protein